MEETIGLSKPVGHGVRSKVKGKLLVQTKTAAGQTSSEMRRKHTCFVKSSKITDCRKTGNAMAFVTPKNEYANA